MICIYTSETAFIHINSSDYQKSLQSRHYSRSPDEETVAQSGLPPQAHTAYLWQNWGWGLISLSFP